MNRFIIELKNELEKNTIIQKLYNTDDNHKDFLNQLVCFQNFTVSDIYELYDAFKTNIIFLNNFAKENEYNKDLSTVNIKNIDAINNLIFEIRIIIEHEEIINIQSVSKEDLSILIPLQNMLVIYSATTLKEKPLDRLFNKIKENDLSLRNKKEDTYYRGESDFSYKLLPSLYRDYDVKKYGNKIDYNVLFNLYKDANLINKYDKIFSFKDINYSFCSFMQHSRAYSPYLDLTFNPYIALSFSTCVQNSINKYQNTDSSVYEFNFKKVTYDDDIDSENIMREHDVYLIDKKLRISSYIRGILLCKCKYSIFDVEVIICKKQLNDRMKYQRGSFLYINKCVIANGILMLPITMGDVVKYRIPAANKEKIYSDIIKEHNYYSCEKLMNPYDYFSNAPID